MINKEITCLVNEECPENEFDYKYLPEPEENTAYLFSVIFLILSLLTVMLIILYPETAELISEYLTEISEYDISTKTISYIERISSVFR